MDENQNVEGIVDLMAEANIRKEDPGELEKEVKKEDCPLEVRPLEATREEKEDLESLDINAAIDKVLARLEAEDVYGDHQGIQGADDKMDETNIKGSDTYYCLGVILIATSKFMGTNHGSAYEKKIYIFDPTSSTISYYFNC